MKKFVCVLVAALLLCMTALPAFAVSDCKAYYDESDGRVHYSCNGSVQIELRVDGKAAGSKAGTSISGTLTLDPGTHSFEFSDLDSKQTVKVTVPGSPD
ncbi:MAG: hypothetical protein Q4E13_12650, partial [Clostridia bacterium]|nr:hypothetical protein [Clostridia bacterium]